MTTRRKYWLHFKTPKQPTVQARAQVEAQTALNFGLDKTPAEEHQAAARAEQRQRADAAADVGAAVAVRPGDLQRVCRRAGRPGRCAIGHSLGLGTLCAGHDEGVL